MDISQVIADTLAKATDIIMVSPGGNGWNEARKEKTHVVMVAIPVPRAVMEFLNELEELMNQYTDGEGKEAVQTLLIDIFMSGIKARQLRLAKEGER